MPFWDSLLRFFGLPQPSGRRSFDLDSDLSRFIQEQAARERRPAQEVANRLMAEAVERSLAGEVSIAIWEGFSRREQEVTALICLGFTTSQLAQRLGIQQSTAKTHVAHILTKCGLHRRSELRLLFEGWDFSNWA